MCYQAVQPAAYTVQSQGSSHYTSATDINFNNEMTLQVFPIPILVKQ